MLAEVRRTLGRAAMLAPGEPAWVGVSGGVDSMVLLHVLLELGHPCLVAHVDHGLRGAESDADRAFVQEQAARLGLPCRVVRLNMEDAAQGTSVQMAARELRYAWFRELLREGPGAIALGHHADDAVETLLLHLLRGTGGDGWGGIPAITRVSEGKICRPLLDTGREELMEYAAFKGIPFREDASNKDPKYLRNRVRNELLPLMEALRPGARRTMRRSVNLLSELAAAANVQVAREAETVPDSGEIPLETLRRSEAPQLLLMRLLKEYRPHPDVVRQLLDAVQDGAVGTRFPLGGHFIRVGRHALVAEAGTGGFPTFHVLQEQAREGAAGPFRWRTCTPDEVDLAQGMHTAWLDMAALQFPLVLRPWQHGDRMRPLGLAGSKRVSDILIDGRVEGLEKEGTYVLVSGGVIVWLAGHRIAEGVSPRPETRAVLRLERLRS